MDELLNNLGIEPRKRFITEGLCLGNNVMYKGLAGTVREIGFVWVLLELNKSTGATVHRNELRKLPITKESLVALGFAPDDADLCPRYYYYGKLTVVEDYKKVLDKNGVWVSDLLTEYDYYISINDKWFLLDSIHHLQNIARDLYGLDLSLIE